MPTGKVKFLNDMNWPTNAQEAEWWAQMQLYYDQCPAIGSREFKEFSEFEDAERFFDWLVAAVGHLHGATGTISVHQCSHDDAVVKDCRTTGYREVRG